jgi:hypothetical protein
VFRLPHRGLLSRIAPRHGITTDSSDSSSSWIGSKDNRSTRSWTDHLRRLHHFSIYGTGLRSATCCPDKVFWRTSRINQNAH